MEDNNKRIPDYEVLYSQLFNDINDIIYVYGNDNFCESVIYRLKGVLSQSREQLARQSAEFMVQKP